MAAPERDSDVLIVGAGASGAAAAWSLSRRGLRVTCLEQGRWIDPSEYAHTRQDYELARQTSFAKDPNVRDWPEDYPINNSGTPIYPLMVNAVGGSTVHWSGHFPRMRPSDFRVRTLDGVADDWPFTYWDLEPFYDLNDSMVGVSGLAGDPGNPPRSPRQTPPLAFDAGCEAYLRGLEKLGWHWWPCDNALISEPFGENRSPCNCCGPCDIGCPIGAMSSAHVTYWPKAVAQGVQLITHARAEQITVDRAGRATGALYYDAQGVRQSHTADVVVMAANGVGTPRLLLNSTSARFPHGLANNSGVVGAYLMFHPVALVSGVFEEIVNGQRGPIGGLMNCQEFYETDISRGFVRGFELQLSRNVGPLSVATGGILGSSVPWGSEHHQALRSRYAHTMTMSVMLEDLPEPENRVTLDPDLTDAHGIPAPRIEYRLGENSLRILDFSIERGRELFEAADAVEVLVDPLVREAGWHLMGTCRMGDDPERSVLNGRGQAHECPNLFVIDGSTFTTSAAVNPTSTIQAVALRCADWLGRNYRAVAT